MTHFESYFKVSEKLVYCWVQDTTNNTITLFFYNYRNCNDNYNIILTWSKTLTTFFLSTETTCFDYCKKKRTV